MTAKSWSPIAKTLAGILRFKMGKGRPIFATYDVTSRCNMKCTYCGWWKKDTPELSSRDALRVIDQACQLGISFINLCGGEPMMREDLIALAKRASTYGCVVGMNTNGTLLNSDRASRISEAFDVVTVSLDGPEEIHEKGRRVKGSFKRALDGIKLLRSKGVRTGASVVLSPWNIEALPEFMERLRNLVAFVTVQPIHPYPPPSQNRPSSPAIERVVGYLLRLKRENPKFISVPTGFINGFKSFFEATATKICHAGELYMAIDPTGKLKPCAARHDIILGNIFNTSIGEMLSSRWRNPDWDKVLGCEGCWLGCTVGISMWMKASIKEAISIFGL